MFRKRSSTVLLGLLLCAASAAAQVNVTLQLPFAQMPARVAEWRENESLIRIVVQNTEREQYEGLMLSVELSKDGRRIARSRDGHPAQPRFSLRPGETRSLSWREVISEEAVEYDGSIRQQVIATGELPEGQYRLCVQVLNAQLRPISPQACGSFGIVLADPPVLVSPIGGAQASPTPLLQWRPSNPPAPGLQYQVTVKVRYRGQTPAQAMASNPVRLQATVPTTSYQVPVTEQLGVDAADPNYAGHVWQVQALLNGRPYGRNRGLSQIEWFVVPPIAVDTVKPSDGRPIAVVEWEVPYEEIRPGRPIKLQVPPIQEDTVLYVLRVRVPEKLSLQQLEQLRMKLEKERLEAVGRRAPYIQDTFVVQSYPPRYATIYRMGQDTFVVRYWWPGRESGIYGMGQDTAGAGVDRTRYTGGFFLYRMGQDTFVVQYFPGKKSGGYFLYALPQDTTEPAELPNQWKSQPQLAVQWTRALAGGGARYAPPQDTFAVQYFPGKKSGGYFLYALPQDTTEPAELANQWKSQPQLADQWTRALAGGGARYAPPQDTFAVQYFPGKKSGGYFLYALPQDTTEPAELVDYYVPNGTPQDTTEPASAARSGGPKSQSQVANQWTKALAGGGARYAPPLDTIVPTPPPLPARMDAILVMGQFIPTHVGLPMPELELDPGDGPVCGIPVSLPRPSDVGLPEFRMMPPDRRRMHEETRLDASWRTDRRRMHEETRINAFIIPPNRRMHEETRINAFIIPPNRRMHEETRLDAFIMPPGGGAPVLWPNGNPPRDPDWPWVGVIGTPVLEGIEGEPGPGKPQNWCGTEYIWTGPRPKSPKELILTPVIPRPR
jgi:hypothetical protein